MANVVIVDDYTFKIEFKDPNPLYLETATKRSEYQDAFPLMPAHYLSRFHKDHADADELAKMVADAGFEDWTQLFTSKLESYWDTRSADNLGAPSLHSCVVLLNFNSPTPANEELIQNLKFRQALSIAIDREDFNNVINTGLAIPQQMTLLPTSRFFKEEYAQSWAQHDVDLANQMLDELGLQWDANGEFRIGPDGKKISFLLEEGGERPIEAAELLAEYWRAIGIDMDIKLIDRELFHLHMAQNEGLDVHITKYGMMDGAFIARPDMFLPVEVGGTDTWATLWARWRENTYEGQNHEVFEKPPDDVIELIDEERHEADQQQQHQHVREPPRDVLRQQKPGSSLRRRRPVASARRASFFGTLPPRRRIPPARR
ncbi:MAG: ABC transporter substrate-binding protein [Spirochaetaceae bacterium]|nr:ABC transporter substrate-binding protein [Spirochaetaceae bacterium]